MAFLQLLQGREPGARFPLDGERAVIGRSSDCDVPLDVAAVSRRHAAVLSDSGQYFVEDLGSRNGTILNMQRIAERTPLRDGDRISICDQTFEFQSGLHGPALGGTAPLGDSSLAQMMDDGEEGSSASVMATLELGGRGSASWRMSAKPEVKLSALVEISHSLGTALSLDEILPKLLDSLFKIFVQADRGFVVMRPHEDAPLVPVATKSRRAGEDENMRISRTIVEEAMKGRKAILSADAASDERFGMAQSIADFQIRSMICAPMINAAGEPLGVIQIDTSNQKIRFTDEDLEVLAGVASQAAISLDNARMHKQVVEQEAMKRDLELARRMQLALLPPGPPELPGYHFFDYYEAARHVGGDYYDYIPLADGRFGVVVGDVAGKGMSAALVMAKLSSDVRFTLASERDPAKAMTRINADFARHDLQDKFVTMIVAIVDPAGHELTIVNAGHMAPLLRNSRGQVEEIGEEATGLPLGVTDDFEYEGHVRKLAPGDYVVVYTDGFSEAMNDHRDLYGIERLVQLISSPAATSADLGRLILDDVRQFVNGYAQSDDMCLACFGRDEKG